MGAIKNELMEVPEDRIYIVSPEEQIAIHKFHVLFECEPVKAFQFIDGFNRLTTAKQDHVYEQCERMYVQYKSIMGGKGVG